MHQIIITRANHFLGDGKMSSAALRLLEILEKSREVRPETPYIRAWGIIFGVEDKNETVRKLGLFFQLVQVAAEEIIQLAPNQQKSISYWQSRISNALLSANGSSAWNNFITHIDQHTFEYLRLHSQIAELTIKKSSIDFQQLESAKNILEEAIQEISSSSTSSSVKISLIKRIRAVVNAINDFAITGDERVFDEFKATLFDLSKTKEKIGEFPGKSKIRDGLSIISDLMSTADGATAIAGPIVKLLENLG